MHGSVVRPILRTPLLRDRLDGLVSVECLPREEQFAAASAAESGEIALVNAPVDALDDLRTPHWSYDGDRDELVVSAETAPGQLLPIWVCFARALAGRQTWDVVLPPDRLDAVLDQVPEEVLKRARNVGGVAKDRTDAQELIEWFVNWEQKLCEKLREYRHAAPDLDRDERNEWRSGLMQLAKGIAASVVHLLDCDGVDVVREIRVPECSRKFSDSGQRADLAKTIAHQAAIESSYGHFGVYRQLFEHRERKRDWAMSPAVDAADPYGSLIGSLVVVGDGVPDRIADDLEARLDEPAEVHSAAPSIAASIPLRIVDDRMDRDRVREAVDRALDPKLLEPTREAVLVVAMFCATIYDVTRALWRSLSMEGGRQVRIDEIRRALASLPPDRLLPGLAPSAQRRVSALLGADEPLSQRELCRRGDLSSDSWRRHREVLAQADLVREVDDGWRIALSGRADRSSGDEVLPWYVDDDLATLSEALAAVAGDRAYDVDDPWFEAVSWPPDPAPIVEEQPEFAPIVRALSLGTTSASTTTTSAVQMGPSIDQASLQKTVANGTGKPV